MHLRTIHRSRSAARSCPRASRSAHPLLPLDRNLPSIAAIGPSADSVRLQLGDYHYPAHLELIYEAGRPPLELAPVSDGSALRPGPYYVEMVSVLQGILSLVGEATEVRIAPGCDETGRSTDGFAPAVEAAASARLALVVVGGKSGLSPGCTSGEFNDRADLGLPGVQQQLVEAVVGTGTPTVVVLLNGRPLALPWIAEHVPAIVEAWLPGEEGGAAVADVLFGDVNPAGRLPVILPRAVGQVPVFYNHKPSGGRSNIRGDYSDLSSRPLYCFGHGLSYTEFEYGGLEITPARVTAPGRVAIAAELRNSGRVEGEEVVQLYVHDVVGSATRPVKQLAGFARIELAPGQRCRVGFELDLAQLSFFDARMQRVIEPGEIELMIGASSDDIRLRGSFQIEGKRVELASPELPPTRVTVTVH